MSKRGSGKGTIHQREDGRLVGRLSLGKDVNGDRQRKTVYGRTQQDVIAKLDEVKLQARLNQKAFVAKDSLAAYLQRWLNNDVAVNRSAKTLE